MRWPIVERHAAGALDELVTQAALSRARLRGNQDDLRSTGLRVAQSPLEQGELARAAGRAGIGLEARAAYAAASFDFAVSASLANAARSATAMSASTLRSISIAAFLRPLMNAL